MKVIFHITFLALILLSFSVGYCQQEESLKEQSLDDVEALSSKDFPYIEKFHNAVREKLSGNYDEARKLFESCLRDKQDDDAVHFGLAEIAKEQKELKTAKIHFEKAYKLDQENIVYLQELAYLAYEQGRFEDAANYYDELVIRQPRNVDWIYGYSQVLIYNKRYQDAADMLEKLQDQVGVVPEIMMMKADLYQEVDNLEKAEETLLELCKEYPQNREAFQSLLSFYEKNEMDEKANNTIVEIAQSQPENMLVQMELATIYAESGEQEKLMETIRPIIQSENVEMTDKIHQIEQLLTYFQVERKVLLELTSELVKSDENDPGASLLHAEVLTQNGRSKEALPFYRNSLKNSGDQFEIWTTVLAFESAYNDYHALYEDGQKALSYFPNMPFVYYAAAEGAIYTDKAEEGLDILAAGELYLLDNDKQKARFEMRKGEAYFRLEEYKKGIQHFETALSINAEDNIRITYALSLANAEIALSVAKEQLDKVSENVRNEKFYLAKAQYYIAQKKLNDADEVLRAGLENSTYKAELHDRLGDVLMAMGKIEEAVSQWRKAKESGSRNKTIDQKIKEEKIYAPKYF